MSLLYYITTVLNIACNHYKLHTKKTLYLWNLYFYIMSALVWKGNMLSSNCFIYFMADLTNEIISKKLNFFTVYHHLTSMTLILINKLTSKMDNKIIELGCLQELTTIPLVLFYMGYLPKHIYNLVFSYSFIFVRFIYYNYETYKAYITDGHIFNKLSTSFYILMNITNLGIALQMNLVPKLFGWRPAIEYLRGKQLKIA